MEDLEAFLESSGKSAADYRNQMKPKEARSKVIDGILASRTDCKECKPVYEKYQKIFLRKQRRNSNRNTRRLPGMRKPPPTLPSTRTIRTVPKGAARGAGNASQRNRRTESTADRGTGGFEEAAGHPLLGTESHTRHRGKQRAAQEAAHQGSLAG